jgi:hypothetical protein
MAEVPADAPVGTARTETDPAHGSQCAGQPLLNEPAAEFEPLELQIVENRPQSRLSTEPIERHHYLKYRVPVGADLRYLVRSGRREGDVLAC